MCDLSSISKSQSLLRITIKKVEGLAETGSWVTVYCTIDHQIEKPMTFSIQFPHHSRTTKIQWIKILMKCSYMQWIKSLVEGNSFWRILERFLMRDFVIRDATIVRKTVSYMREWMVMKLLMLYIGLLGYLKSLQCRASFSNGSKGLRKTSSLKCLQKSKKSQSIWSSFLFYIWSQRIY